MFPEDSKDPLPHVEGLHIFFIISLYCMNNLTEKEINNDSFILKDMRLFYYIT